MLESLPEHLLERTRSHGEKLEAEANPDNPFVLYWMRTAVRTDENPALDVARLIADRQGIPLLVYHAISKHYQYCLLYTSPSPRDRQKSRMPSSA